MERTTNKPKWFEKIRSYKETTVILIVIVLVVFVSIFRPIFLSGENIKTTMIGMACDGIIGVGMTIALISGGFDLSVGSVMGLTAMLTALFASMGVNIWVAAVIALGFALLIGFANGMLIGKIGLNPFITTLGMMSIARGLVFVLTEGSAVSIMHNSDESFRVIGSGTVGGIPVIVIIFIALVVVGEFMVRKSVSVMKVFYVGSNEKAAKLSGINVSRVKISVYTFTAFMAGVAGVLALSRFGVATANLGEGTEMNVISAGVIGGASLSGGEGSVLGTVLGVFLLSIINNALVLFNISVYWQNLISGVILILAVTFDLMSHKKKYKKIA